MIFKTRYYLDKMDIASNISLTSPSVSMATPTAPLHQTYNNCATYVSDVKTAMLEFHAVPRTLHYYIYLSLDLVVLPAICTFGIVGNILNLVVLSRKQLSPSLDRMERCVYIGLVALAVSDLAQCALFMMFLYRMPEYVTPLTWLQELHLFCYTYREALVNAFLFSSTWLTVLMACGRYAAICHPLTARGVVQLRVTIALIAAISISAVLVAMPFLWKYEIRDYSCSEWTPKLTPPVGGCGCTIPARIPQYVSFQQKYHIAWVVLELVIPLAVLVFCNACLVVSLRRSVAMQREYRATRVPTLHITPTLVAIIAFHILLISPSELVKFLGPFKVIEDQRLVFTMTALLQAINSAANFILYCVINVHFRQTVRSWLCCFGKARSPVGGSNRGSQLRTNHTSTTYNLSEGETEM